MLWTSLEAYRSVFPKIGEYHMRIIDVLSQYGGLTDEEIQDLSGLVPNTQRPRRVELQRKGILVDSGTTRKTKSGRNAVVWVLKGESNE